MTNDPYEGKRIRLLAMPNDPDPIPAGTTGTVMFSTKMGRELILTVDWDINRSLSLICPPDLFQLIPEE